MADEEVVVSEEVVQPQEGEQDGVREMSATERQARETGWKPRDEWQGNPDDWKPAKAYVEFGELIGKYRAQNQRIAAVETALKQTVDQQRETYANGYQQALTDLKKEKREALAEGDLVRAEDVQDKIDETKEKLAEVKTPQPAAQQPDPDFVEWLGKNQWYQTDKVLHKFADAVAVEYATDKQGQVTLQEIRDHVEKVVKQEFPNKFQKKAAPSPDGEGRGRQEQRNEGSSGLSKIEAEMSEDDRQIMRTMIKTAGLTKEEYLKMYKSAPTRRS